MLDKNNIFHDLIVEVRTLTASHNPIPLFEDLHLDSLDGECHFTTSRKTLLVMSKVIEDTLKLHKKRCSLYSGFQELSRFKEHHERYAKLAHSADQIFVIGVADTHVEGIADNVHIRTTNADIIRNNWIFNHYGQKYQYFIDSTRTDLSETSRRVHWLLYKL